MIDHNKVTKKTFLLLLTHMRMFLCHRTDSFTCRPMNAKAFFDHMKYLFRALLTTQLRSEANISGERGVRKINSVYTSFEEFTHQVCLKCHLLGYIDSTY